MKRCLLVNILALLGSAQGKWVEGRVNTKENWAFLARFCFLSLEGQFEYLIEFERDMGTPNLLLYYDDESQWPAVYHSSKTCKDRESVLNNGQNQMVKLSHWYPDTEYSGCIVTKANKELPAAKTTTQKPTIKTTTKPKNITKIDLPSDPAYYDQFLKTTNQPKYNDSTTITTKLPDSTSWYELIPTENFNTTTELPDDLWESIGPEKNSSISENLKDVEILFDNYNHTGHKIKRSIELYERYRRRRLNSDSKSAFSETEKMIVSCHNSRRFRSARERWWFIAISNCDSPKGLDVKYKFLMTNGPDGDFWHKHFSADEFYVLPILLSYTFAYIIVMVAVVMCSVELRSRHLLHSTYKLFLISIVVQHCGVLMQALANIRYASNGVGAPFAKILGQFFCGVSETTFLLMLVLLAKGYTVTLGRLRAGYTVKLTVFMCCYVITYVILFVYQAKAFDPGEVLYLYESPAGYGLIVLRITGWCAFAYSTYFTVKKYPEKNSFYCPFFICGTLWFYAGPLFILTANSYIDKWVRESVVTAVLLFITFCGHVMFLLLTLPVFANKKFLSLSRTDYPNWYYGGKVSSNPALDGFGPTAYHPSNGTAQTVIIPLTRRTEELIGNMYNQYMATPPPDPDLPIQNGGPRLNPIKYQNGLTQQSSTETNKSDEIIPQINQNGVFTVEKHMAKMHKEREGSQSSQSDSCSNELSKTDSCQNDVSNDRPMSDLQSNGVMSVDLPNVMRSKRNILEPIKRDVPSWSLAKGPSVVAMQVKTDEDHLPPISLSNVKKTSVKTIQSTAGLFSTIHEGREQRYDRPPDDIFTVAPGS